jgi:hypothetical protein
VSIGFLEIRGAPDIIAEIVLLPKQQVFGDELPEVSASVGDSLEVGGSGLAKDGMLHLSRDVKQNWLGHALHPQVMKKTNYGELLTMGRGERGHGAIILPPQSPKDGVCEGA